MSAPYKRNLTNVKILELKLFLIILSCDDSLEALTPPVILLSN